MSQSQELQKFGIVSGSIAARERHRHRTTFGELQPTIPGPREIQLDPLLTVEDVAGRLNVTKDWVWDHSSRKAPYLPVIRVGDGTLRYRASQIEAFVDERERLSALRRKRR